MQLLGLTGVAWESVAGSRLRYASRLSFDGISIHYSDELDRKHNKGICVEMSGQGCRDFETFGTGDWDGLFDFIKVSGSNVSRLDLAFDDFSGLIPIEQMAAQARRFEFTARSQKLRIMEESSDGDPAHMGISVCHGSKSSEIYIRCYDKRAEKNAFDEFAHWVRFEIQLRGSNARGWLDEQHTIGERFRGLVTNYVNYRDPSEDTNKRRWVFSEWWDKFLAGAAAISVHETKDTDYNKDRLDAHVYDRNHNCIKSEILTDGLPVFLERVLGHTEELPDKYRKIIQADRNGDQILALLQGTTTDQITAALSAGDAWKDYHAFNDV